LISKSRPGDFSAESSRQQKGESVDWGDIDEDYKKNKTSTDFYDDFQKGVKVNNMDE
jgi:hypothetical protein